MTSEIRANTLKNRVGLGTVSFTNTGPVVSGIVTANGLELNSVDAGSSAGPELKLFRNSASPANADYLGQLKFAGESSTGVERNYAKITGKILDVTNGSEDGILEFAHIKGGSQTITGRWRSDSLQLLNGTSLTVAGSTTVTGNIIPSSDSATDIGTNSVRFANVYTDNLDVSGNLFVADSILHTGDTNTKIRFSGGDTISLQTAGSERLLIKSTGYVGINTTGLYPLDVLEPTNNAGLISITGANTTYDTGFLIRNGSSPKWYLINDVNGAGGHSFEIRGDGWSSDRFLTLTQTGKLGVNNTNPNAYDQFVVSGTGNIIAASSTSGYAGIGLYEGSTGRFFLRTLNGSNGLAFYRDNTNEALRITSTGDVGVGNNSPNCRLAVKDTATHTAYAGITPSVGDCMLQLYNNPSSEAVNNHSTIQFGVYGGSHNRVNTISAVAENAGNRKMATTFCTDSGSNRNERMRITGDGNVNIAGDYTQTSYNLSVTNSSNTNLFRIKTADQGDYDLRFNIQNSEAMIWHYGTDDLVFGNRYDRKLSLITNAQKRLTVSGNYIGINETSPGTYLHVKGTGEMLRLETTASGGGQCYIDFDDETATRASIGLRGSSSDTLTVAALNGSMRFDVSGKVQALQLTSTGNIQHDSAGSGHSYFKGSSEYIFGSQYSSPPAGGPEADFQIHTGKSRASMSINSYYNNAGVGFLQFVSSRSNTRGVLGTKAAINDYHGDIRFMGDNGTNNNSLVNSAQIYVRQRSTISDGDTVCEGEMTFATGNATAGAVQSKLQITGSGKIKYGLHDSSMPHAVQARGFVLYPDNGSNNKTTIRVSGLVSGCFIFQMGYYNSSGQGEGGFACAVSGYMTSTNQYTIDNIKAPYAHANSSISGINKQNSYFEFTITNNHSSYTGGGTIGIIGDQEMTITVTYHS